MARNTGPDSRYERRREMGVSRDVVRAGVSFPRAGRVTVTSMHAGKDPNACQMLGVATGQGATGEVVAGTEWSWASCIETSGNRVT